MRYVFVISSFDAVLVVLHKLIRLVRLTPFDTSTEQGRHDERHRKALLTAGSSVAGKFASVGANLLVIPMVLNYLGPERFGIWATITSFVMLLSFADLGIGNGLMTAVSQASGRVNDTEMRRLATAGLVMTALVGSVLLLITAVLYPVVPWAKLLNVTGRSASDVGPAIGVLGILLGISMPASVAARIEQGLQRGFVASILQIAGAALSVALVFFAIWLDAGLPVLVAVSVGAPVFAAIVNSMKFFGWSRPDLRPSRTSLSGSTIQSLMRIGLLFFALQLALAIGSTSDNFLLSYILGPQAVTDYSIPARLYGLIGIAIGFATNPLWPAYGEAIARGDQAWARRTLHRTMKFAVVGAALGALMLSIALQPILDLWVGGRVRASGLLIVGLGIWAIIESWRSAVSVFMNGSGVVHLQVVLAFAFAFTCIGAKIVLIKMISTPGVPLGAIAAFLLTTLLPYLWFLRRHSGAAVGPI
jgi:O-antigen/teichoic acid export membrane protein